MTSRPAAQSKDTAIPTSPGRGPLLQRKCACGAPTFSLTSACSDCQSKKLLGKPLQTKLPIDEPGDAYEQEADRVADAVVAMPTHERSVLGRVGGTLLQRQPADAGAEPTPAEKTPLENKQETPAAKQEETPATAQPQSLCSPTAMTRAKYLQEPGTSTKDFGLTRLDLTAVTYPELITEKAKGGVRVKPTAAALPMIPSVFTGNDTFTEGDAHFIGQDGSECPSKKYPIRWTITPQGATKIGAGEQEHCADFQQAFDISLKRYAAAVNALAGKVFGSEKAAEKAVVKSVGAAPADWNSIFSCLARKTKLRDGNWHTPRPTTREPKLATNCAFASAFITGTSLPQVGQHASADIIKDCGEAGAASGAKAKPTQQKAAEASKPDLSGATWDAWDEDEAAMLQRKPAQETERLQAKLSIGASNDPLEQEADRVADQVMAKTANPTVSGAPPRIQRFTGHASGATGSVPTSVDRVLSSPGKPLEPALRQDMEQRFGHDFSQVRVHANTAAEQSAREVNANAYTVGHNIVFAASRFAPGTHEGRRLIAHELAHTVQQGQSASLIQRALKFEIQTTNRVWAVKDSGPPDPKLLPRKYAPTSKDYTEFAGEERGDKPAYLSVGSIGGPARKKGEVVFVEAEGPLVTEEAKRLDTKLAAQFVKKYQFNTAVLEKDLLDKAVPPGKLKLVDETNNAKLLKKDEFHPNTFEFKYLNRDGTQLDVHLNEARRFKKGHVKFMKVGRTDRPGLDETKAAQHLETYKVIKKSSGDVVELVSRVDRAKDKAMTGLFNPGTYEKNYFAESDFKDDVLKDKAKPLDLHLDKDGRLKKGRVAFMVKETLAADKEQTAIELQSETGGVIEFETPKWFSDWSELEPRIQEAVDITKAINDQRGTAREVTDKKILDAIDKGSADPLGQVVEWPAALSTVHLKNLAKDKRRLLVEITDKDWLARIQASEAIALSEYESLLKEHEEKAIEDMVVSPANKLFSSAFAAAKSKRPSLNEALLANLKGFLLLVATYLVSGQVRANKVVKATFQLMARTDFGSMFKNLLSADEQALFKSLAGDPKKPSDNPLLDELASPINTERARLGWAPLSLTRKTPFFFRKGVGSEKDKTSGPAVYDWLAKITEGKDLLSGAAKGISDAMGAKPVETKPGDKDFERAKFEVRGTKSHGGNDKKAAEWVKYAKDIFAGAIARASDTPDDPTTPKVDESSKTGLKKK